MNYKLVLTLVLAGLVVLFIIQNVATVEIQFLFWSTQMPRSLLMFLLLAIGIIMGWSLHSYSRRRKPDHKRQNELSGGASLKPSDTTPMDTRQEDRAQSQRKLRE